MEDRPGGQPSVLRFGPITWGDDDDQYTAYGDGWGFEPRTERKLGMGFARIVGPPDKFRGINLRSAGERVGGGAGSPKASGILMVDGVLYLWARNTGAAAKMKQRLMELYFTEGADLTDREVLVKAAADCGMDADLPRLVGAGGSAQTVVLFRLGYGVIRT